LRYAYFITCTEALKDENGEIVELRCTYDPATKGGDAPDGRKVKATLHWVSAQHALEAEVRLYDHLLRVEEDAAEEQGEETADWKADLNPESEKILHPCYVEPGLKGSEPGSRYQFERLGYFCVDPDSQAERPVFNRTVTLRDTWAKIRKKEGK
jgi:glutaminyl-tRNA synthetase